jgi:hypothetical protein
MDYTLISASTWAVSPDCNGESMYACSTLCGMRLGYAICAEAMSVDGDGSPLPEVQDRDTLPDLVVAACLELN